MTWSGRLFGIADTEIARGKIVLNEIPGGKISVDPSKIEHWDHKGRRNPRRNQMESFAKRILKGKIFRNTRTHPWLKCPRCWCINTNKTIYSFHFCYVNIIVYIERIVICVFLYANFVVRKDNCEILGQTVFGLCVLN